MQQQTPNTMNAPTVLKLSMPSLALKSSTPSVDVDGEHVIIDDKWRELMTEGDVADESDGELYFLQNEDGELVYDEEDTMYMYYSSDDDDDAVWTAPAAEPALLQQLV